MTSSYIHNINNDSNNYVPVGVYATVTIIIISVPIVALYLPWVSNLHCTSIHATMIVTSKFRPALCACGGIQPWIMIATLVAIV